MTEAHPFDGAIALQPMGEGRFRGHTSELYWNFVGPFGGVTAATALNALLQREERIGDPLSLTANFMAPIKAGAFDVETKLIRSNRSTQHWSVQVVQEGEPVLGAIAVFAARRETWGLREAVPPVAPPPEECRNFEPRLEIRWPRNPCMALRQSRPHPRPCLADLPLRRVFSADLPAPAANGADRDGVAECVLPR